MNANNSFSHTNGFPSVMCKRRRILCDCRKHVTWGDSIAPCQLIRPTSSSTLPGAPAGTQLYYSTITWGRMKNAPRIQTNQLCGISPKSLKTTLQMLEERANMSLMCSNDLSYNVSPYNLALHSMSDQPMAQFQNLASILIQTLCWILNIDRRNTPHGRHMVLACC